MSATPKRASSTVSSSPKRPRRVDRPEASRGTHAGSRPPGVYVARLVALEPDGRALVALEGKAKVARVAAAAVVGDLDSAAVGGAVAVVFQGGRLDRPIVIGPVRAFEPAPGDAPDPSPPPAREVAIELDGRRLSLTAAEEIVLRCGEASITLSADGRVAVRGTKVLSRASGVNKIKGGAVQIN